MVYISLKVVSLAGMKMMSVLVVGITTAMKEYSSRQIQQQKYYIINSAKTNTDRIYLSAINPLIVLQAILKGDAPRISQLSGDL